MNGFWLDQSADRSSEVFVLFKDFLEWGTIIMTTVHFSLFISVVFAKYYYNIAIGLAINLVLYFVIYFLDFIASPLPVAGFVCLIDVLFLIVIHLYLFMEIKMMVGKLRFHYS